MGLLAEAAERVYEARMQSEEAVNDCKAIRLQCEKLLLTNGTRERDWLRLFKLPYFMLVYRSSPEEALDFMRLKGKAITTIVVDDKSVVEEVGVSIYSTVADPRKGSITVAVEKSFYRLYLSRDPRVEVFEKSGLFVSPSRPRLGDCIDFPELVSGFHEVINSFQPDPTGKK